MGVCEWREAGLLIFHSPCKFLKKIECVSLIARLSSRTRVSWFAHAWEKQTKIEKIKHRNPFMMLFYGWRVFLNDRKSEWVTDLSNFGVTAKPERKFIIILLLFIYFGRNQTFYSINFVSKEKLKVSSIQKWCGPSENLTKSMEATLKAGPSNKSIL